jgi:WD40 repeat protein
VLSPDGRTEAVGGDDGSIRLWDVANPDRGRPVAQLPTGPGPVRAVAFSPDGHILAAIGAGTTVRLWDTGGGLPRPIGQPLTGHTRLPLSLAFSPDGRTLASGGYDGTVRLWRLAAVDAFRRDRVLQYACDAAQGGLDRQAWTFYIPSLPYRDSCVR